MGCARALKTNAVDNCCLLVATAAFHLRSAADIDREQRDLLIQ